jgi:hypothetical protein
MTSRLVRLRVAPAVAWRFRRGLEVRAPHADWLDAPVLRAFRVGRPLELRSARMISKERRQRSAPLPCREVAGRHDRRAARRPPHHRAASAPAGGVDPKVVAPRPSMVDPSCRSSSSSSEVSLAPGEPTLRHDQGARLSGRARSPPPRRRPPPARRRPAEAFQRLRTLPGEQAQVDWAHFGKLHRRPRAQRTLWAFVMVLSYSRRIFLRFFPGACDAVLRARARRGVRRLRRRRPRVLLYDNLKSAVLERHGDAIRFHPTLLALAAHYRFEPRPVAVARGNEKGRVERAIRYIREAFFEARDLCRPRRPQSPGAELERTPPPSALGRRSESHGPPGLRGRARAAAASPLTTPFPATSASRSRSARRRTCASTSTTTPSHTTEPAHARRLRRPRAGAIVDGNEVVATHARSWDRGQQLEHREHLSASSTRSGAPASTGASTASRARPAARRVPRIVAAARRQRGQHERATARAARRGRRRRARRGPRRGARARRRARRRRAAGDRPPALRAQPATTCLDPLAKGEHASLVVTPHRSPPMTCSRRSRP